MKAIPHNNLYIPEILKCETLVFQAGTAKNLNSTDYDGTPKLKTNFSLFGTIYLGIFL